MAVAERRDLGVVPIRIDSVTGTVEASKAELFDRALRPHPRTAERWKGVWRAHAQGVALPPVAVYRIGTRHVVRDGHHRISVARAHRCPVIDAHVVALVEPAGDAGGHARGEP